MKYPQTDDHTARVMRACQILKHADAEYFAQIIRDLAGGEKRSRHKPRAKRQTRITVTDKYGNPARGGKGFVSQEVIDRALREAEKPMSAEDERDIGRGSKRAKAIGGREGRG